MTTIKRNDAKAIITNLLNGSKINVFIYAGYGKCDEYLFRYALKNGKQFRFSACYGGAFSWKHLLGDVKEAVDRAKSTGDKEFIIKMDDLYTQLCEVGLTLR